jgi:hypothetical protein
MKFNTQITEHKNDQEIWNPGPVSGLMQNVAGLSWLNGFTILFG